MTRYSLVILVILIALAALGYWKYQKDNSITVDLPTVSIQK